MLEDIAVSPRRKRISEATGMKLEDATLESLGRAEKINID